MIDYEKYTAFIDNEDIEDLTDDEIILKTFFYIGEELKSQLKRNPTFTEIMTGVKEIISETKRRYPNYPNL